MSTLQVVRSTHWLLGGDPAAPALVEGDTEVTYGELADLVAAARVGLGPRQLTVLEATATVDFVVAYLAALAEGHPVLLLAAGDRARHTDLLAHYPGGTTAGLHPDLALLLSTSGSTGSPKLVRLSRSNVLANARSIGEYLELRSTDVAITSLPLHYCYGLSVLHSHLLAGATVVLTDLSVSETCFWDLAERTAVTGLAGVPHTYALLDSVGFASRLLPRLPSLRYLTQAGGRMPPDRVRAYADLLGEAGVDLFVMYGQTEATARMAYLPPDLAHDHPDAVGVAVPAGELWVEPVADAPSGTGELVYRGPNVMMGYAESLADLARGPELTELRTGDLARITEHGLVQVLGRLDRHAKVLGHRVDLDRVEAVVADGGDRVRLVARPDRLWAFVTGARSRALVREAVVAATGLRGAAVQVVVLAALPVTASGKPDDATLRTHVEREEQLRHLAGSGPRSAEEIRDLYAVVLGRPDATVADSFAALGGDSLSYVEVSTWLGRGSGSLPAAWPSLSAADLAAALPRDPAAAAPADEALAQRPRRRTVAVDVSVALRAAAALAIVVSHVDLAQLQGGAHVLLVVAGYNLARFQLAVPGRRARVRGLLRSARVVAVPAMLYVGTLAVLTGQYRWPTVLLLNGALGSDHWDDQWQLWFLEALVWSYLALAALVAVPALCRAQRAAPFASALVLLGLTLGVRYWWTGVEAGPTERYTLGVVAWCVALGLAEGYARARWQRVLVAAVAVAATAGFFADGRRETLVVAGVVALLVVPQVRLPRALAAPIGPLASASLWIYLTQWQVYPPLEDGGHQVWALVAVLAVGVTAWWCWSAAVRRLGARRPARDPMEGRRLHHCH